MLSSGKKPWRLNSPEGVSMCLVSVYRATLCHGTEPVVKTERKKIERSYRQHCHARNLTPTRRPIILPSKLVFFSLRSNVKRSSWNRENLGEEFFFSLTSTSSRSTVPLRCSSSAPSGGTPVEKNKKGTRWRTRDAKTTESSSQKNRR